MVVCGTFACGVIAVFIIYRFIVEDVLDGNPTLTIVLILATVFTLQTVLPFCINDDYLGAEHLNSRKILVATLAFGLDFSVMLSRAFFLVFSKGGVFTAHINGYLQGLMVFFMFCVQLAISVMFFALSTDDSAVVVRSLIFIALLGKSSFYEFYFLLKFIKNINFIKIKATWKPWKYSVVVNLERGKVMTVCTRKRYQKKYIIVSKVQ